MKGLSEAIKCGRIKDGDMLAVGLETGEIRDEMSGAFFHGDAVSDLERDIMDAGGLPYLKARKSR